MLEFTLTKRAQTKENHLVLLHADGEVRLPKLGDGTHVSRLKNWRQLLTPGREIRVHTYRERPIQADLRLTPDDPRTWDSEPMETLEWVSFWTLLHQAVADHREQKRAAKAAQVEDE